MHRKHNLLTGAAGVLFALAVTFGVSAQASADSGSRDTGFAARYVSVQVAGGTGQHQYRRYSNGRRAAVRHTGRLHRGHYLAPPRRSGRAYAPRYYRGSYYGPPPRTNYRNTRLHRYGRYHRSVDVGAVVAGLIAGGLVYELLNPDHSEIEAWYEER